jgi:phosphoribosyl-AMP cyclohydrolase
MSEFRTVNNANQLEYGKIIDPRSKELLVPVIVVDVARMATDGLAAFRMQGWANNAAIAQTIETGLATFFSRSQGGLWVKGEISGNTLEVCGLYTDCDQDSVIYDVNPNGPTCHNGMRSCFNVEAIGK